MYMLFREFVDEKMEALRREALTISRFVIVGLVATFVHMSIVWFLVSQDELKVLVANLVAFTVAFGVSFSGQYWWAFRSSRWWLYALIRFFTVSFLAFAVNNVVLLALLSLDLMPDAFSAMFSVLVIPVFTYVMARFWAFS